MALEKTISEVVTRLRQGRFPNERSISHGVVLRILRELGWDIFDPRVVWPEYSTGEGRVDFALCVPPEKPAVLVEVKQPGCAEEGVRQLLGYAFHVGAPFAVLTDGKTWSFYLPAEQGQYEDRRVYKLDLIERQPSECAAQLQRFLAFERVKSGEARQDAVEEYRSRSRKQQSKQALAEAWKDLLTRGDELLVELLSSAVETKVGFPPDEEDVEDFLRGQVGKPSVSSASISAQRLAGASPAVSLAPSTTGSANPGQPALNATGRGKRGTETSSRNGKLRIKDQVFEYQTAIEGLKLFLQKMAVADPTFLERCAAHPENTGHKRRYIARSPTELFPHRPDHREYCDLIAEGWYLNTNLSNTAKRHVLGFAGEVAGLKLGVDFDADF